MYTYNPFGENPVWDGWVFLKSHNEMIVTIARAMITMKEYQDDYNQKPIFSSFSQERQHDIIDSYNQLDEFVGNLIWEMRFGARGYYNHWLMRHLIRVMVTLIFGVDPLRGWVIHYAQKLSQSYMTLR